MKKIELGTKEKGIKYDFRETCFGIVYKNKKFYITDKLGELSLIGGGREKGESKEETLRREFLEEAGLTITKVKEFITIDCYWLTRNNKNMNSLANFYIIEVSDEIKEPTEEGSKLVLIEPNKIKNSLKLPYQKEAIRLFLENYIKI